MMTNIDMSTNDLQRTYNNTLTRNIASSSKQVEPIIQATFQAEIFPETDQGDQIMPSDSDMEDNDGVPDKEISQSQQFASYVKSIGDIGTLQQHLAVTALAQADLHNGKIHDIFMDNQGIQSCFRCINAMSPSQLSSNDRENIIAQGKRAVDPEDVSKILTILYKFCSTNRNIRVAAIQEEGIRVALSLARYRFSNRYQGANQLKCNALNLLKAMLKDTKSRLFFHRIGGVEIVCQLMQNPALIDCVSGCILQALRSVRILRLFFRNNALHDILQLQRGLTSQLLSLLEFISTKSQGVEQLIAFGGIEVVCHTLHSSHSDTETTQGAVAILANCARRSGSDASVQQSLGSIVSLLSSQDHQTCLAVCQTIVSVCFHAGNDCEDQIQSSSSTRQPEETENNILVPGRDISRYNMLNVENCTQIAAINILPKLLPHIHCTLDVLHNEEHCPIVKFDAETNIPVDATADRQLCTAATKALASLLFCDSLRNQVNSDKLASKTLIEHLSASDAQILRYTLLCVAHMISDRESSNRNQLYFLKKIQKKDRVGRVFALLRHPAIDIKTAAASACAALLKNQDFSHNIFRSASATLQNIASTLIQASKTCLQQESNGMEIDYKMLRLVVELLSVVWQLSKTNFHACKVFSEYGVLQTVLGLIKCNFKPKTDQQLYVVTKLQEFLPRVLACLVRVGDNGAVAADSGIIGILANWHVCDASPYSDMDRLKAREHGVALVVPQLREAFSAVCRAVSENHKCCLLLHQSGLHNLLLELVADASDQTAMDAASALREIRLHIIAAVDGFRHRVSTEKVADPETVQQTINFVTFQQERQMDTSKSTSFVRYQSYVTGEQADDYEDDETYKSRILGNRDSDQITVLIPNAALGKSVVELSNQLLQNEVQFQLNINGQSATQTASQQLTDQVTDYEPRDMKASLTVTKLFKDEPVLDTTATGETEQKDDTNSVALTDQ